MHRYKHSLQISTCVDILVVLFDQAEVTLNIGGVLG